MRSPGSASESAAAVPVSRLNGQVPKYAYGYALFYLYSSYTAWPCIYMYLQYTLLGHTSNGLSMYSHGIFQPLHAKLVAPCSVKYETVAPQLLAKTSARSDCKATYERHLQVSSGKVNHPATEQDHASDPSFPLLVKAAKDLDLRRGRKAPVMLLVREM